MSNTYDIIVIGAGIAGSSTAAMLANEAKVLLLETESQPGYHATGRSAAYFAPSYGNRVIRTLTRASERFFRNPSNNFAETELLHPRSALFSRVRIKRTGSQPRTRNLTKTSCC